MTQSAIKERLEYLRGELRAERISYGELAELQSLAAHIDPSDVELLEAAGVPEHSQDPEKATHLYVVEVRLDRMKVEHVGEALRRLSAAADTLTSEGLDVGVWFSVERDRDGVERWPEWIDDEGNVIDVQPWEENELGRVSPPQLEASAKGEEQSRG